MNALNVLTFGGAGPRVAFCHGLFGQGRNWSTLGRRLGAEGYRVALPDLPNHGRSPWTDDVDYPAMAEAVGAALRRLGGDDPWTLVGHSLGGKTAMWLALHDPSLVERLCVVDIAPVDQGGLSSFAGYVTAMRAVDLDALPDRATADALLAEPPDGSDGVPDPDVRAFLLQNLRRDGTGWRWQMNLAALGAHLTDLSGWPRPKTDPYPGPVLWIAGAESGYVRPEYAPAMRALFPQTRLVTIKQAGHWVHADQPEVFGQILRSFLPTADAPPTGPAAP